MCLLSVGAVLVLATGIWAPQGQSLAAVAVQGGEQGLFYRQEEVLTHLQTREIFNFKARSYFLFKIQTDRDGC